MSKCLNHDGCGCQAAADAAQIAGVDQKLCPLCGEQNMCETEIAKTTGNPEKPCWCRDVTFSEDLLSRVSEDKQGLSCVCRSCATN